MHKTITVVIPTHDRRETVLLAIGSALRQTREPAQVLVVADGCADGTAEAIRALADPRVELLDLPKGPGYGYAHRNEALRIARGDVVAWLADDDLYLDDHLEQVGELFDAGLADVVTVPACVVHASDHLEALWTDWGIPAFRDLLLGGENRTPASAVAHIRQAALAVGGWRAELPRAADMDLWQRMLQAGARPATRCAPTVLHFRASRSEQSYAERVRQNGRFAERIRDPAGQMSLRTEMERAVHQFVADRELRARAAEARADEALAAASLPRADTETALRDAHDRADRSRAESQHAVDTLNAIYAGGWWRLRARLRPALRLAARLRATPGGADSE